MQRETQIESYRRALACALLSSAAIALQGALGFGQEIRIRLVDGRNGHATKDCINVYTSPEQQAPLMVLRTDSDGVAVVRLGKQPASDSVSKGTPCRGDPTSGDAGQAESIGVFPDWNADCRIKKADFKNGSRPPPPFYSVEEILRQGVAGDNECGKFTAEPRRGELILYVRPPHWWEAFGS